MNRFFFLLKISINE